jgi:hypothetical protein
MKVAKIKTGDNLNGFGLTDGKVYTALPRKDTLAPYTDPYIWFSGVSGDYTKYYLIEGKGKLDSLYPISEFKTIEEIREENIENILSL